MEVILTHNNADFDALASLLGANKLHPEALPVLPQQLSKVVAEFMALYKNGLPFIAWDDFKRQRIHRVILTDTQNSPALRGVRPQTPTLIYEHHPLDRTLGEHERWHFEPLGAITTYFVEQIQAHDMPLTTLEATLMALGIYADTGMLTYGGTTPRDIRAAAWLLEHGAVLDTVRRFLSTALSESQQTLMARLLEQPQTQDIQGYQVTLCSTQVPHMIDGINMVIGRLMDLLDPTALIILVEAPDIVQLVARSQDDAINVGMLAQRYGGGGHPRAAAAAIAHNNRSLSDLSADIWQALRETVRPATRIADLMSWGVKTVNADDNLRENIHRLRQIGHEGFPVLQDEALVGLLTLRDADRALEHGLNKASIGDLMQRGTWRLKPQDSVFALEQMMVESRWGQIPIVNDEDKLIGIVTRTDLIKHWARIHPTSAPDIPTLSRATLVHILGEAVATLVARIAHTAQEERLTLYMVGGVVRDLFLGVPNMDIDFVVEGDGIQFAKHLQSLYGGEVHSFSPFGTAKWHLDAQTAQALRIDPEAIPSHIDFATARNEFYAHPTALPTVYSGSIKLDLARRDFTINTLAVQLSPVNALWRIIDVFGGMNDLRERVLRVLHSLSFVDDPTRVLRAVRFAERLAFVIEPRTAELIASSLPMMGRITGERLRNELNLMLQEQHPERALLKLEALRVPEHIHPAFHFDARLSDVFEQARQVSNPDLISLYWHLIFAFLAPVDAASVSERLLFGKPVIKTHQQAALLRTDETLSSPDLRPSHIAQKLDEMDDMALLAAWLTHPSASARNHIERYRHVWRHVSPISTGHTLIQRGLKPSRSFKYWLAALRNAWLDGEIQTEEEEHALLTQLISAENQPFDPPSS